MLATAVAYIMRNRCLLISILALASSAMLVTSTFAAEAGTTEHEGVPLKPQMLVQFGGFGITNSMLVTWLVAAGIIVFSQLATRRQRGPEHDDRDVGHIFRDVVCLGDSGQRCRRILERIVWPKR